MSLAGSHRVQRVTASEKRGRRHSSEVTVVAVNAAEAAPASPRIDRSQVRVDTFRASGAGGQHRNKTDSGVRLTHLPSGIVVTATEERSQHQNRDVAWARLAAVLSSRERDDAAAAVNQARAATFEQFRSFTWTGWRDEVKAPGGRKARMGRALAGRLDPLLD